MKKALFSLLAAAIAAAVPVRAIILAALLLAVPPARATTGELLTRFGLDDAPQYVVTDAAILDGLPAGATAIRVPKGVSVDLAIPQQLKDAPGHPYTLVLKIKITDASSGWVCLANMPDSNDSDAMIYLHKDTRKVCIKQFDKGSVSATSNTAVQKNRWTVLAFAFGAGTTTVYMDGDPIYSGSATLANSFADCYRAGDYILVGADNDGDDNPFFLADARIYDGAVAVADELPGTGIEEDPFRIASVADWELLASNVSRGMALGDDFPYYRLVADIGSAAAPVTRSVGTDAHPFCGDFDGGSNTIRVALSGSASGTAPFARTDGARIHDLKVAGSVSSAANHAAGLIGLCVGQTVLQRCDVSADVSVSGAGYAGGIVGHGGSGHGLTVFDSLYTGTVSGFTAHAGGLVGWCDSLSALYLGDCLFNGSFAGSGNYHPIACRSAGSLFPVYLTGDTVYYPNTVPPTEDDDYVPFKGTPVSETLVPDEWDVPVTAVDGNVYYLASAIAITPETGDLLLRNGDVLSGTGGPDTRVLVADGATVTLRNVCITNITADTSHVWGGITCQGSATIVLQGVNYLRGGHPYVPGLYVPPGKTLVIRGDGTLEAGSNGYGAGIGGGRSASMACGDIVIEGGTIVATGGDGAAGIGSGPVSTCGTITVSGGSVTATGGNAAAGIGAGQQGTNGTVTVTGGIVDATGGPYGAGIGSGYQAVCGDIAVSGGTVAATGGQYAAGIGSGLDGTCGDITLSGGTVSAAGGQRAPGIGSGASQTSSGVTATCGDIALEEGVVRVTADGGGRAAVGAGNNSTGGAVTVGGAATTVSDTHYVYAPCVLSIATTADWDAFASRVNRGVDSYDGLTVTLAADIAVSTPVGTNQAFRGTFDGGGHVLSVAIEGTGTWTAPFRYIDGATIANRTVTGTVTSGGNHAAGLVGACGPSRPNAIRNCTVAVDVVADGTGYAGGIVGQGGDSTLALEGCVFSGSVRGFSAFAGGLLGWGNAMTLGIADCLVTGTFAPAGNGRFHPIACKFANRTVAATVSGAYWINAIVPTATGDNLVAGAAGAPVSAILVPGAWAQPVAAADGNTYYAWTPAPAGRLLAHLAFDDAGNAGTNLLRAAVGLDAIVRATPATPVEGPGEIVAVSDAGILSGLAEGDGAVAIPLGQHLAVPIPAPLLPAAGRPYTVVMKIRVPDNTGWRSLLNMPASNDSDAMVYLQQTTRNIYLKQFDKSSGAGIAASNGNVAADRWTTLAFAFGENATDIYRDGTHVLHATGALAGSYADCAASGGYVLVGADDSGDDNLFYLSDVRIYEGAVAVAGVLPGSGTPADPYLISSADDWSVFAANVSGGLGSGCYRLAADIGPVAVPAGAVGAPFSGTFDGGGHTLTVALSGTDPYVAPFAAIDGATIGNLVVAGTVSGGMHCSGLVGLVAGGTNMIENCRIDAAVSTSKSHFGGVVGHGYVADTTLRGCVFSGSLSGGTYVATFNAWSDEGATTRVVDCLDASASAQPIGRGADAALVTNAYYAATKSFSNGERLWSAGNRGRRARSVTEGEGVTIDFGAPVATYGTSGIAAYATGIVRGGVFYAGAGETVSLGLSAATPPAGEALDGFAASAGTLAPDGGAWSLAMPDSDVVVTASFRPFWAGSGTAADPFRIAAVADWNELAAALDGGADTAGKHFLLATNLSVTTMLGLGSAKPFQGVFDGGGHTLTVALHETGSFVAPFSAISNATIANLAVAGTVEGGMHCAGLVGIADGENLVSNCLVSAAVTSVGSHFGGILGHGRDSTTELRGCTFSGTLAGGSTVATLFGWGDSPTVTLVDCLDASESPHPIGRCGGTVSVANTYFLERKTFDGNSCWNGDHCGRRARSVTAVEGVAIDFGAPAAAYPATGIAAYAPGIAYEGVFYAGEGETVALSLAETGAEPGADPDFVADGGTLSRGAAGWTLAMPDADVTVSLRHVFPDGAVLTGEPASPILLAAGATVTISNLSVNASGGVVRGPGITCLGDATIILKGENEVNGYGDGCAGIQAGPAGTRLVIRGEGSLSAEGRCSAAGIGCGSSADCGDIAIEGGSVEAFGGSRGAGIGGAESRSCGEITILGDEIAAYGGDDAPGIGDVDGFSGRIVVKGGRIVARGDDGAAGIGSGEGFCAGVSLLGGIVSARGGAYAAGVGSGWGGMCGPVVVSRGVFSVEAEAGRDAPFSVGKGADYVDPNYPDDASLAECSGVTVGGVATNGIAESPWTYVGMNGAAPGRVVDLAALDADFTAQHGDTLFGALAGPYQVFVDRGATVLLRDAAITNDVGAGVAGEGLSCYGDATILLAGENYLRAFHDDCAGVEARNGTLEIDGAGSLSSSGRAHGAGIRAGAVSIGPGIVRVSATKGEGADDCIEAASAVAVADGIFDETAGDTRVFFRATDLSSRTGLYVAQDGEILTGTPSAGCTVAVAAGATVTLRDFVLPADPDPEWIARLFTLGDATIRLEGSNAVSACADCQSAVVVAADSTLVLDGPGSLDACATGGGGVGIGSSNDRTGGNLVIRGGVVRATGGEAAPGIGASPEYGFGDISIEGGTVTATGGEFAAGIGSGDGGACGDISISGGTVTATGGNEGAGIGTGSSGECGDISISGGIVLAAGGDYAAGIGTGEYGTCGAVSIGAGVTRVVADAGRYSPHSVGAGMGGTCGALTVGGEATGQVAEARFIYPAPGGGTVSGTVDLASVFWDIVVLDGAVLTGEPLVPFKIEIDAGASVTVSNVTVLGKRDSSYAWAGITCLGDATVALEGTNVLRGFHADYPGLQAGPENTTLRILGPGALVADSNGYAPGIGGVFEGACGNISIEGGAVTATGGEYAAGIGSSEDGRCGDISISGGTVTATGGALAAGIGAGNWGTCGDIVFSGGVSTATGGRAAPAVGCGSDGACGDVTLSDTVTRVTAVAGSGEPLYSIGAGSEGFCGAVTVGGTETGCIAFSPYVYEPSDAVFAVSFDANGGLGSMAGQAFLPGIPQNLSTNEFRLAGKVFLGWSDAADGSGAFLLDGQSFVAAADTTLYAQWADYDMTLTDQTGWMRLVDGQSLAGTAGTNAHVIVAAGATVTLRGVTILGVNDFDRPWAAVTCEGDATIVLEGTNVLRGFYDAYPGLQAGPDGTTLRILGPGSLTADSNGYGAGVGGGDWTDCGDISVEGGTIVAVGGRGSAGIGGGEDASCGTISISGGDVSAWSVADAPGIGGGAMGSCGGVAISGGVVAARGGSEAPGIGPGYDGTCGEVAVSGASAVVLAVCGFQATDAIASSDAVSVDGGLADSEVRGVRAIRPPELVAGENRLTLDGDGGEVRVFTPAADGWYRFRIPGEAGWLLPTDIDIQLTMSDPDGEYSITTFGARTLDLDLNAFAELQGGMTYKLAFSSEPGLRGSEVLPLFVDAVPVHGIALDVGTANGAIRLVDTGLPPVEGSFVALAAEPADGFALGAWTVTDATGGVVRVRTGFDGTTGFLMPDSDVAVTASFAQPHGIDLRDAPRFVSIQSVAANGILGDEAAPGARVEIEAMLRVAPELTLAAAGVSTASGVPVACSVRRFGLHGAILSFTMPDEPVVVEPVLGRAPPAASIGEERGNVVPAAPNGACRSFVPAFTGEYVFRGEHGGVYEPEIYAVDGLKVPTSYDTEGPDLNHAFVSIATATLLAGREYFVTWISPRCDLLTVMSNGMTYDEDLLPAVVAEAGPGGTLEVSATRAVPGHPISIHATPAPGFRVASVAAVDANGSPVQIFEPKDDCATAPHFTMPSLSVTVTATFVPTLPWYLDGADDEVVENYEAWASRYGADPAGTNLVAFLLDADPAAAVPAGAEPLKVVDFAFTNGVLRFEIASEWVAFQNPNPPPPGVVRVTSRLGNGILVLRSAPSLPCDDADWEESLLWIVDWLPDGHVVAEFEPKRGASALPARFFRPAISTVAPDDDSGGQVH